MTLLILLPAKVRLQWPLHADQAPHHASQPLPPASLHHHRRQLALPPACRRAYRIRVACIAATPPATCLHCHHNDGTPSACYSPPTAAALRVPASQPRRPHPCFPASPSSGEDLLPCITTGASKKLFTWTSCHRDAPQRALDMLRPPGNRHAGPMHAAAAPPAGLATRRHQWPARTACACSG